MLIAGTDFGVEPWPIPKTTPGLGKWKYLATGFQSARDFGAARDIYEGSIIVRDTPDVLDSLQTILNANRNGIVLSGFNDSEMIFGANVDYSGSINATVTKYGTRKNLNNNVIFQLELTFQAIAPTLLTTAPSLTGLNLQEQFDGDRSTDVTKLFDYSGVASYLDHKTDAGIFHGTFLQTTEQMKAIRAYLLQTARANVIPFPAMGNGVFYPFGANEGDSRFQMCNVISWSDKPVNYDLWELEITFSQAAPIFAGGDSTSEEDTAFFFAPGNSEPLDFFMTPEY